MKRTNDNLAEVQAQVDQLGRGKVPRELRQRQVLTVALVIVLERGYHSMSMDEVAARCGVSKPVVYDIVGSKSELFGRLLDMAGADLTMSVVEAANSTDDQLEKVRRTINAFFQWVDEHGHMWTKMLAARDQPNAEDFAVLRDIQSDVLLGLLREAFPTLEMAAERGGTAAIRVEGVSRSVIGTCESLADWWLGQEGISADEVAKLAFELIAPGLLMVMSGLLVELGEAPAQMPH